MNIDPARSCCIIKTKPMLSKKYRINKGLFKKIFKKGKSFHSEKISLKTCCLPAKNPIFAFVIPSKTAKKSVERNKLKRRARHIVKKQLGSIKGGMAAVFFFRKGAEKMEFLELEKEMLKLFERAKII